jgi:hypothetical protein
MKIETSIVVLIWRVSTVSWWPNFYGEMDISPCPVSRWTVLERTFGSVLARNAIYLCWYISVSLWCSDCIENLQLPNSWLHVGGARRTSRLPFFMVAGDNVGRDAEHNLRGRSISLKSLIPGMPVRGLPPRL